MKVSIQGQNGSFHHLAASKFFDDPEIIACKTFTDTFDKLDSKQADFAVVAIENSLFGSINQTYDLLLKRQAKIIGEVYIQVHFNLLGIAESNIASITDIYSVAPALAECQEFLTTHYPAAEQHEWVDTAASAEFVASQNKNNIAAIASEKAGKIHGLKTLHENIEDNHHNYTRFIVLSKASDYPSEADKTSVIIHTSHKPGALLQALKAFADHGINLSKLESRPVPGPTWQYIFYLDYEAALDSPESKLVINELEHAGRIHTVLGTYKRGVMPK